MSVGIFGGGGGGRYEFFYVGFMINLMRFKVNFVWIFEFKGCKWVFKMCGVFG